LAQVGLDPTIREDDAPATREDGEPQMSKAQQVFEALMRSKGHTDFNMNATGKYSVPALQMRWSYFLMGWEMKGVTS
jgi:hypothetical protein